MSRFVSFHRLLPVFLLSGCSHCIEKLNVSKHMLHSAEQTFVGLVFEWLYSVASYNYRQLDVVSLQLPFVKHGVPLLIGQGMCGNVTTEFNGET